MKRKMSGPERYMLFFGRQYPLNFGFKVTLGSSFDETMGIDAIQSLARRHAVLFSRTAYVSGKQMELVFSPDAPLIVNRADDAMPWEELLVSCMVREFDPFTGPLFTLSWRNTGSCSELFFVFHHGAADGISAVWFINDFLSAYSGLPVDVPSEPVMPVLHEVLLDDIERELAKRPEPAWKSETLPEPRPFDMPAYKVPDFCLRFFVMEKSAVDKLTAEAKSISQTVNSYLGALILKESAELFTPDSGYERSIQCPVDFRRYLKEEFRSLSGIYNGIVTVKTDCSKSVTEIAEAIKNGIAANREGYKDIEEYYQFRDSFDNVPDPESLMMSFPDDDRDYDFSFSNIGRTPIKPQYNETGVKEFFGPVFTAVFDETVIGLNTTDGTLRMSMIFSKTKPNADKYRMLGDRIAAVVERFTV